MWTEGREARPPAPSSTVKNLRREGGFSTDTDRWSRCLRLPMPRTRPSVELMRDRPYAYLRAAAAPRPSGISTRPAGGLRRNAQGIEDCGAVCRQENSKRRRQLDTITWRSNAP